MTAPPGRPQGRIRGTGAASRRTVVTSPRGEEAGRRGVP